MVSLPANVPNLETCAHHGRWQLPLSAGQLKRHGVPETSVPFKLDTLSKLAVNTLPYSSGLFQHNEVGWDLTGKSVPTSS